MLSEMVTFRGQFRAVHVNNGKLTSLDEPFLGPTYANPSYMYYVTDDWATGVKGTYAAYFDGHLEWVPFKDLTMSMMVHSAYRGSMSEIYYYYVKQPGN